MPNPSRDPNVSAADVAIIGSAAAHVVETLDVLLAKHLEPLRSDLKVQSQYIALLQSLAQPQNDTVQHPVSERPRVCEDEMEYMSPSCSRTLQCPFRSTLSQVFEKADSDDEKKANKDVTVQSPKPSDGASPPPRTQLEGAGGSANENIGPLAHALQQRRRTTQTTVLPSFAELKELGFHAGTVIFIKSSVFDMFWMVIIGLYAAYMGLVLELQLRRTGSDYVATYGEAVFTSLFMVEVSLRTYGFGPREYFCGRDLAWSYFDVSIVVMSALDLALAMTGNDSVTKGNANVVRGIKILRIIRVLRVTKIIRGIRFLRELRLLISGILCSLRAIGWTLILLLLVMYLSAVMLVQLVVEEVQLERAQNEPGYYVWHFGTLTSCILTLLQVMSGDSWYSAVGRPLFQSENYPAVFILVFYFFFTSMGILNIVTGIFVEQTVQAAQMDAEVVNERLMEEQSALLKKFFSSFDAMDDNGDQVLTNAEFCVMLQRDDILDRFSELDIKPRDAAVLFALCDVNNDGQVDLDEFIAGCKKSTGFLRPLDYFESDIKHTRMLANMSDAIADLGGIVKGIANAQNRSSSIQQF
jgi:hypothetical protein